ncbi:hypothetical protein B9Z65_3408 [Elsinoe australis]|uniref:Uncharacterized protein n=1 Tax=Elsinoe australis TaxID=40998 RepID=A0A2P7ZYB0_9PEZI|nr:hypothetical protein B9Z65_3408 [Elsinoe australis]
MADLTEDQLTDFERRMRARRPQNPSPRDPSMSTEVNQADDIERQLVRDSHRAWGFVIYRCTYDSDDQWATFLDRLRTRTRESFAEYNGEDILDLLAYTIIEDRSVFEDATVELVREHFGQWCETAPQQEQGAPPGRSIRYSYCIQVDASALKSVVHDAQPPPQFDSQHKGFVNLIDRAWQLNLDESDSEDSSERAGQQDQQDTGWMRVAYDQLYPAWYCLVNQMQWPDFYRRPPEIARA